MWVAKWQNAAATGAPVRRSLGSTPQRSTKSPALALHPLGKPSDRIKQRCCIWRDAMASTAPGTSLSSAPANPAPRSSSTWCAPATARLRWLTRTRAITPMELLQAGPRALHARLHPPLPRPARRRTRPVGGRAVAAVQGGQHRDPRRCPRPPLPGHRRAAGRRQPGRDRPWHGGGNLYRRPGRHHRTALPTRRRRDRGLIRTDAVVLATGYRAVRRGPFAPSLA